MLIPFRRYKKGPPGAPPEFAAHLAIEAHCIASIEESNAYPGFTNISYKNGRNNSLAHALVEGAYAELFDDINRQKMIVPVGAFTDLYAHTGNP